MAARRPPAERPVDILPRLVDEVIVTSGKAFRAAKRDGKGNSFEAASAMETRIPAVFEKFNSVLDDLECDILRAKAVLLRDINQLRANRKPPPPPPEQKPVAPPAPMAIDLESPKMAAKDVLAPMSGPRAPGKPVNKPVAPFPNMGFDSTSPEAAPAPAPAPAAPPAAAPRTVPKPNEVKNVARPPVATAAAAAAGRPASAPPRKDSKATPAQIPKPSGVATAPQTPFPAPTQTKASSVPAPNVPVAPVPPMDTPSAAGHENLFTDMTFSLAPPAGEVSVPGQKGAPQPPRRLSQQQLVPGADITNVGAGDSSGVIVEQPGGGEGAAEVAKMDLEVQAGKTGEDANLDAKIDGLFDLGPGGVDNFDLDYNLDGDNGDSSNFNDMYFGAGDSTAAGEFDDAYFNLDA